MIYLPSDNSHAELVRVFRHIQEALNSKVPTTTVIDKTVTKNISTSTSASGGGSTVTVHNDLTGRSDASVHPASSVTVSPTGGISSTTVQGALAELDSEKAPKASPTLTGTTTVDQIQFDTANPAPAFSTGQIYWNLSEGTIDMNTDIAGTTLSIGQEQYVRVVNKTGVQVNDGQVVYINDAQGNRPTIALAKADSIDTCMIIGVATNNIADNAEGYVTTLGIVRGYNTSSFTDGDRLYLSASTAGAMTATPPSGSGYVVHVATALNSTVNGSIFVHPGEPVAVDPSFTENTDLAPASQKAIRSYVGHDVTGEFTGFDVPENVTVSYDSTTRKVTLTGSFNAYYRGQKVTALTNGWVSDAHAVATAPYFLYYDGTNFVWSTAPWTFDKLMICVAIWNSAGTFIYALRECHGLMQWQSHRELHETTGTYLKSGGDLSSYVLSSTTAADRRPDIAATAVADEDLITTNSALTTKLYSHHTLSGTGTSTFTTGNAEILPVTGSQPYYNQFSSPNWVQAAVSNNTYTTAFCIAIPTTNDAGSQAYRYVWIQGQSEGTLAQMRAVTFGSLNLGQLAALTPEFVPIAKVIIRYIGGNWTIEQVEKLTVSRVSGVSTSGNFLSAVTTDASLTGAGTAGSSLSVARSATVPVVNGTAAVGTSDASSRSDHVHPTDTSRAADSAVVHNTGNETGLAGNKTWTGTHTFSASPSVSTGASNAEFSVNSNAGTNRRFRFLTAGSLRWIIAAGSTAESGSNSGSPFTVNAYDDSGTLIDQPIVILRASGAAVTINRPCSFSNSTASTSSTTGALIVTGGVGVGGAINATGTVTTNPTGDGNSGGFGFSTASNNSSPAYGIAGRLTAGAGFGTHGAVTGDYATYLRMIGGTNRGWIWQSSAGNVASISAPKGILNLGLSTDRNIRIDPVAGGLTIRTPASSYAVAYAFNAPDDTTIAGGFGVTGTSVAVSYHYIGPDYANPLVKVSTSGFVTTSGGIQSDGGAITANSAASTPYFELKNAGVRRFLLLNNSSGSNTSFNMYDGTGTLNDTAISIANASGGTITFASARPVSMGALTATSGSFGTGKISQTPVAFASLPAGSAGDRAFVNNNSAGAAFGSAANGSGSTTYPVYHDGVSWKIG